MTPAKRKYILAKKGITQTQIAKEAGVTLPAINNILHDRDKSARLIYIISTKMGLPKEQIWPKWFKSNYTNILNKITNNDNNVKR